MVKGLSHIVYVASSGQLFQRTIQFYRAFGFKVLTSPNQADKESKADKESWLKMEANEHAMTSDIVIRLVLNVSCVPKNKPDGDQDWGLNETALALTVFDVGVSIY
jgi:hypothetical protein